MSSTDSTKQLRKFGLTLAILLIAFFAGIPFLSGKAPGIWVWIVSGILAALALAAPKALGPVQAFWIKLGHVLGAINSRILMSIIFVGLIVPLAAIRRLFSKAARDPWAIRPEAPTYRIQSAGTSPGQHMRRPF